LRLNVSSVEQMQKIHELREIYSLDFWTELRLGTVDIRLTPEQRDLFVELDIASKVMIPDVGDLIAQQSENTGAAADYFDAYHTYDEVVEFVKQLAQDYPRLVTVFTIGKTLQGRDIYSVLLTSQRSPGKQGIVMNGGVHAREWISVATVTYLLNALTTGYGTNPTITKLVDSFEWTIIPILNPDGYVYSWTTDRMWRKNRRPVGSGCVGVDNNRNWEYKWGPLNNPCAENYPGETGGSELENQAIQGYLLSKNNLTRAYIDFHAYGQLWMYPWGWTTALTADDAALRTISLRIITALRAVHGTVYTQGSIANIIYVATGSSADFAYGVTNTKYAFGVEGRDTGRFGFLLPANQIIPSGQETLAGVIEMGNYILAEISA